MENLFEIWRELKDNYLKYIDTGLPLNHVQLEEERRSLFQESDAIAKYPIIELTSRYEEFISLKEACLAMNLDERFADFAALGLFPHPQSKIYKHQFESFRQASMLRNNIIVTTGTGSGKTESFLFPLLYNLLQQKWQKTDAKAIKALILYPLNALAEDQMRRLRCALSSDSVVEWFDGQGLKDQYITFGRYTGATPFSGNKEKREKELHKEEASLIKDWESARANAFEQSDSDYLYDYPNMDQKIEHWNRYTMQDAPPDLLITNYSMLNIMLMRAEEQGMFEKTHQWLENPGNVFYLVIDELHSYRGTSGTEIAYLLRLLLFRLGLTPESPQVRYLCTSASLQKNERTEKFIQGFFGVSKSYVESSFAIINDSPSQGTPLTGRLNAVAVLEEEEFIMTKELLEGLRHVISKPCEADEICSMLFEQNCDLATQLNALEKISIALARYSNNKVIEQPQRAHYFFRNVDGLWACSNRDCSAVSDQYKFDGRLIGKLYRRPRSVCSCGAPVYEVLTCRQCGEMYFNGWQEKGKQAFLPYPRMNKEEYSNGAFRYLDPEEMEELALLEKDSSKLNRWKPIRFSETGEYCRIPDSNAILFEKPEGYKAKYPNECFTCGHVIEEKFLEEDSLTPVHRHYTGVQKVNQLMADALLRELRKSDEKHAKLVMFSDSRQAAAKLSAGIELDHYRDMVRALIYNKLGDQEELFGLLLKFFESEISREEEKRIRRSEDEDIRSLYHDIIDYRNDIYEGSGESLKAKILSARKGIKIGDLIDEVGAKLLKAGMNPGGPKNSLYERSDGYRWDTDYNFDEDPIQFLSSEEKSGLHESIRSSLKKEIVLSLYSGRNRSFESLAVGRIVAEIRDYKGYEPEFINNSLKILGESYRIFGIDEERTSLPKKLWKYWRKVQNFKGYNCGSLKEDFAQILIDNKLVRRNDYRLTGSGLRVEYFNEDQPVYRCPTCGNIQLTNYKNVCTYCFHDKLKTIDYKDAELRLSNNYYRSNAEIYKTNPTRLHCEELTGQTGTEEARARQRRFQGRFLDVENPRVDEIDLLSVTTTMEVGVDIGSLKAVVLGNVPPQRFNYQQRVGRAGRRNASLSIALTIAKGNSHDQTHFNQSYRMVSAPPVDPYLEMNQIDIFLRFARKEIFHEAIKDLVQESSDIHGDFGLASGWNDLRGHVANFIEDKNSVIKIIEALRIGSHIPKTNEDIYTHDIKGELLAKIDDVAADNERYPQVELGERLANAGVFPMYGFPTQVRNLYERKPENLFEASNVSVQRPLDLAISEFAPGSQVVKDKKILKAVGVVGYKLEKGRVVEVDGRGNTERSIYRCEACKTVYTKDNNGICKVCLQNELKLFPAISPTGFCIERGQKPADFDGRFEFNPGSGEVSLDPNSELNCVEPILNLVVKSNTVPSTGIVHQVNDNRGQFFKFSSITGSKALVVKELLERPEYSYGRSEEYALISSRHTGVITLSIASIKNENYKLKSDNIFQRAAFISWAYMIRKSVCNVLDIEASEFDVGYRISPETRQSEIFLVEKAVNGAGYCYYLNGKENKFAAKKAFIDNLLPGNGKRNLYSDLLVNENHKGCLSSCYDCLRDYNNQRDHSFLNWRLALDLVGLSSDPEFKLDFSQEYWQHGYIEDFTAVHREHQKYWLQCEELCFSLVAEGEKYLLVHPFWSMDYVQSLVEAFAANGAININDAF